ncbi:MAG: helix-turn-helix transcriptional regulator [Candidatus Dojkabacteria bacterium]|jgi:DNA-binding XRE family transcriptional regulator|nr:MAG: helix-turn-helix transcriptional regulator [Candidatus Dojkabacteria bacterium]
MKTKVSEIKIKNNLIGMRKKKKLSRAKIAELCGISQGAYFAIEMGRSIPNLKTAYAISKALGVKLEKLFYANVYEK